MDFKPASFSADDVLQVLDEQIVNDEGSGPAFEMIESHECLADARLSVFRSREGALWVVCIEAVRYSPGSGEHKLEAWLYGNCLRPRGWEPDLYRTLFKLLPESFIEFDRVHGNPISGVSRRRWAISRDGQTSTFEPSESDYERVGLRPSSRELAGGIITEEDVLRFLCASHSFFAEEGTLRGCIEGRRADLDFGPSLSSQLEMFLQTKDWTHPHWLEWDDQSYFETFPEKAFYLPPDAHRERGEDEMSPRVEAFRSLAEAIMSGDLSAWNAQDPQVFNSHWRFWAERQSDQEEAFYKQVEEMDAQVQVLEPEALAAFIQDARATVRRIESEMRRVPSLGVGIVYVTNWHWGDQMISSEPHILAEWLRRRANRSNSNP